MSDVKMLAFGLFTLLTTGCMPGYIKSKDLEAKGQGPASCAKACEDLGMRMTAMVLVGDTVPGCVCQVAAGTPVTAPPAASPQPPPAPAAPAAPAPTDPVPPSTPAPFSGAPAHSTPVAEATVDGAAASSGGFVLIAAAAAARQQQDQLERMRQQQQKK